MVRLLLFICLVVQCIGFQQVRMVPGRMGICFVDFEHEGQAGTALQYLQVVVNQLPLFQNHTVPLKPMCSIFG